jgi:hypothetical protein
MAAKQEQASMTAVPKVEGEKEGSKYPAQKAVVKTAPKVEEEKEDEAGEEAEQKRLQRAGEEQARALNYCIKTSRSPSETAKLLEILGPKQTAVLQVTDVKFAKLGKDEAKLAARRHASTSSKDAADVVATAKSTSE